MGLPIEHCCECDEPTGRAGPADDSIYTPDGYGPLCEACYSGAALDKYRARVADLDRELKALRSASENGAS